MSAAASISGFMKRHVVGPALIRRNPFFYGKARSILEESESQSLSERRAWSEAQLKRTLQFARRTEYGRKVTDPYFFPLYEAAQDLAPNHADLLADQADVLTHLSRHDEAELKIERAFSLNPLAARSH